MTAPNHDRAATQNPHLDGSPFRHRGSSTGFLLLHGLLATPAELRPLAQGLVAAGYSVSVPRLPGHGATIDALHRCRWQDWLATGQLALRELATDCDRCVVGGSSMGALLALCLAAESEIVSGVVGYAPCVRFRTPLIRLSRVLRYVIKTRSKGREVADSIVEQRWQGYREDSLPAAAELLSLISYTTRRLQAVKQPVLLFQGLRDETVDPRGIALIFSRLGSRSKSLVWLPQSSHCLVLDVEQERVLAETLRFAGRLNDWCSRELIR